MSSIHTNPADTSGSYLSDGRQVRRPARRPSTLEVGIIALALYSFTTAALMAFAPSTFFSDIGPFGVQNDHYLRDLATYEVAFGVALLISYRNLSWRVPILGCAAIQFALHSINHLLDIGAAHPAWLGPADFVSLSLSTLVLVWLVREALRQVAERP